MCSFNAFHSKSTIIRRQKKKKSKNYTQTKPYYVSVLTRYSVFNQTTDSKIILPSGNSHQDTHTK